MKIIYFSWVRDKTGIGSEQLDPPASVTTVAGLVDWLKGRGDGYVQAFADPGIIRAAVNQQHVKFDHPISAGDEVAFFPPVTGG